MLHRTTRVIAEQYGRDVLPDVRLSLEFLAEADHRSMTLQHRHYWSDVIVSGGCAAVLSGTPSTLYAWVIGGDVFEATRAAGAMLIPATSTGTELGFAAALVHVGVSLFWSLILVRLLPQRHTVRWAVAALALVAVLDLRVIGQLFPEILALSFWPQFADHIAFGAVLGSVLAYRRRQRGAAGGVGNLKS